MFVYYATDSEFGLTHEQVAARLPHLTFSPGADLSDFGFYGYCTSTPPASTETHFVLEKMPETVDGVLTQAWEFVAYSTEQKAARLAAVKANKNAEINQWREAANFSTFPHGGKMIACDRLSRSDIDAVANSVSLTGAFPTGFPGGWKAVDNSIIPLANIAAFKAMFASMTEQGTANFTHAQALKTALASATSIAEVEAIVW